MPPAVRADALTRRFGELVAVDGLSFEVERGELFGLVGPDGAGKTTTLRMLSSVLLPSSGDAIVGGASVTTDPESVKRRIAYMSQRFGLYTDLTVDENLAFYADLYEVPRSERPARLERLFAFSNLGPFRDRLAGKLSGGMKQKLGLCCALIHEPEILLLDEPTFGVDPVSRRDLWLIVHERVAHGLTAVVATAYLDEAERFDRVALLDRGRLLALDRPPALCALLEGRLLEVRAADARRARSLLEGLAGLERISLFGDRLHLVVGDTTDARTMVVRRLREAGIEELHVEPIRPTLEDVFMARLAEPA